jgi:two-component system nitrogen regulation response regulator GlnG
MHSLLFAVRWEQEAVAHVLLIDDDPVVITRQVRQTFPAPSYTVDTAPTGAEGLERLREKPPDVVLLDLQLRDRCGLEIYQEIRRCDARIPVIFLTQARTADAAIDAMQHGAFDYLFQPLDSRELHRVLAAALEVSRRMHEPALAVQHPSRYDAENGLVGTCPPMRDVYKAIGRVAAQNVPVLISGESGTGKELVALAIYQHSLRARGPFLALNCAAIPESLLESELFGYEKGAFTGADRRRIGKFEQCHSGTIFLDEIGDMPMPLQAKILRLLQDQTFERIGGNQTIHTDVRLIAASNRDLKAWAAQGKFRADLYYRLSVFSVPLPPLRHRGDDIPLLVQLYTRRISAELGKEVCEVAPEAMEILCDYPWPGNIRELQSVLKQAILQATGTLLLSNYLPPDLMPRGGHNFDPLRTHFPLGTTLAELERRAIQECLTQTGGNRQQTAELLGISTRTLLRKIRGYELEDPLRHGHPNGHPTEVSP